VDWLYTGVGSYWWASVWNSGHSLPMAVKVSAYEKEKPSDHKEPVYRGSAAIRHAKTPTTKINSPTYIL